MGLVAARRPSLHKPQGHGLPCPRIGPGALLQVTSTRAALARRGPGGPPFPNVHARLPPSDSLPPAAVAPVPLAAGRPRCGRLCCAAWADDTGARHRGVRRRRGTGSPLDQEGSRQGEGLPGAWAVLCGRAMVAHPAGDGPRLARGTERPWWPASHAAPWASGKRRGCGAACPMARMFAYLRIATAIVDPGARLAPGAGGLTLGRTGFAPAGRRPKFHEGIVSSNSL